jgi:B-box zinc finger/Domain of unknown function (DUF5668)
MTCANHPDRERVAFCQNCGKPLCQECSRVVGNAVYCEPCLAARLAGAPAGSASIPTEPGATPPPPIAPDVPSPALATLLGFIPGVGAMYNGQYAKGIVHLMVFAVLASIGGIFKLFALGWIIYQAIDANHTARARLTGAPLPNPFGLNDIGERLGFGRTWPVPPPVPGAPYAQTAGASTFTADANGNVAYTTAQSTPPASSYVPPASSYVPPVSSYVPPASSYAYTAPTSAPNWGATQEYNPTMPQQPPYAPYAAVNSADPNATYPSADLYTSNRSRFPGGAIWLIAIGSIFLIGNMGFFHGFPVRHLVPIFLIGFGVWLFVRRMTCPNPGADSYNLRVFRALRGSIWIMVIGVLLFLDSFDLITWSHSWPLLLIVAGAMALFRTTAYSGLTGNPYAYAPPVPPVQPVAPSPAATTSSIVPYEEHSHDSQEGR